MSGLGTTIAQKGRVLDMDIETRRIGFHSGGRFNPDGCEPVIIAWSWADERKVDYRTLIDDGAEAMLEAFLRVYEAADVVTGHYLRKFDLPILAGAYLENDLGAMPEALVSDTKCDLRSFQGLSKSQENLSNMLRLSKDKYSMSDHGWRGIARLEPKAMEEARRRCVGDVKQHKELRVGLLNAGALRAPKVWRP